MNRIKNLDTFRIKFSSNRSTRPRACTSYLNQFKFPAVVDENGNPALLMDSNNSLNICKELNNPLQVNKVSENTKNLTIP